MIYVVKGGSRNSPATAPCRSSQGRRRCPETMDVALVEEYRQGDRDLISVDILHDAKDVNVTATSR